MPRLPIPLDQPSDYERGVIAGLYAWRNPPKSGMLADAYDRFSAIVDSATDKLRAIPGVDWTLDTFVAGIIESLNDLAHDLVWSEDVYSDLQKRGLDVQDAGHAHRVDISKIDKAVAGIRSRYAALGAAEGATTGFVGAAGIVPDILALTTLNLRATGLYATYYGFDVSRDDERLFALQVLSASAGSTDINKDFALKPISRASQGIAKRQAIESAGQYAITGSIKKIAEKLGIKLTKAKLAQMLPVAGAVVGGGLNVMYTNKVCHTAQQLYRERFLLAKYGPAVFTRDS